MQTEPRKTAGSHSSFSEKNVQGNQKCRPNNQKGVQENEQDEQKKVSEKT
jgi:hypothetical protein